MAIVEEGEPGVDARVRHWLQDADVDACVIVQRGREWLLRVIDKLYGDVAAMTAVVPGYLYNLASAPSLSPLLQVSPDRWSKSPLVPPQNFRHALNVVRSDIAFEVDGALMIGLSYRECFECCLARVCRGRETGYPQYRDRTDVTSLPFPEAVVDLSMATAVCAEITLSGMSPCFKMIYEQGFVERLSQADAAIVGEQAPDCMAKTDATFLAAKKGKPFTYAKLTGMISDASRYTYAIQERADVTIESVVQNLSEDGGALFGFLRSLLLQVANALEAAQKSSCKLIHGNLTTETVKLKYLPAHADRTWLFRCSANWKAIPPEEHRGYLAKIGDFSASSGAAYDDKTKKSTRIVSMASAATFDEFSGANVYARTYDMGLFCWSLAKLITKNMYWNMNMAMGGQALHGLFAYVDFYAHGPDALSALNRSPVADAEAYQNILALLRPFGREGRFMENFVQERVPSLEGQYEIVCRWLTTEFYPRHVENAAKNEPSAKTQKIDKTVVGEYMDEKRIFKPLDLANDMSNLPAAHLAVAMSTLRPGRSAANPRKTCWLCGWAKRPIPVGRSPDGACSGACKAVLENTIPTASALEILLTPAPPSGTVVPMPLPLPLAKGI